jgi:hypothetical protein
VGDGELLHHGFVGSYWVGDASGRKSTSFFCFSLGIGMISWFSRKWWIVTLSSAEVEHMAASSTNCETK